MRLSFTLDHQDRTSRARAGWVQTRRGKIATPVFMPVGTQATIRSQTQENMQNVGAKIILGNTYHLLLRPGPEVFKKMGGIHRFMNWPHSVLTDSGGFQVFSLPHSRAITEEGALFKSYIDGKDILLSPETSIQTQMAINSDIMMAFDQCVPSTSPLEIVKEATERTTRWAKRSLAARGDSDQALFGIVQGAVSQELRKKSADEITNLPFDGFAIGGLAVGESKSEREDFTEIAAALLPHDRPRYLMGVGTPIDLLEAVHRGVDMFDCILPQSLAQRGVAYTSQGILKLQRSVYKFQQSAIDPHCSCSTCRNHSRAYLHHLIKANEVLGWTLIGYHNLWFYQTLMRQMREHILRNEFNSFYLKMRGQLSQHDEDHPPKLPRPNRIKTSLKKKSLGVYEVVTNASGHSTIRHTLSGELMHSVNNPVEEALNLYIHQSQIIEKLKVNTHEELVVWDVGLGAGFNSMSLIWEIKKQGDTIQRPMRIVSFENNLHPLELVVKNSACFPHAHHPAPQSILSERLWVCSGLKIRWELFEGDFLENLEKAPKPDIVFYDMFSYKSDPQFWTPECFKKIMTHAGSKPFTLYTYSTSTAVRAAMLASGLYVGSGRASGPKEQTTIASNQRALIADQLLDHVWLERLKRSEASFHPSASKDLILQHQQFM